MGIAEEIKQKEFNSEHHKALVNIIYTYSHIINEMNVFFKTLGITRQQYNVLRILRGQHPEASAINLIRDRMMDKMSDASRIVQRLLKKGLIQRKASEIDKRSVEVVITTKGLDLLQQTDDTVKGFNHLLENLNQEEAKQLNHLLDKLRNPLTVI